MTVSIELDFATIGAQFLVSTCFNGICAPVFGRAGINRQKKGQKSYADSSHSMIPGLGII